MAWRFSIRSWKASTATTSTRTRRIPIRAAKGRPTRSFHSASSALRPRLNKPLDFSTSMSCPHPWSCSDSPLQDLGRRRKQARGLQDMLACRPFRRYHRGGGYCDACPPPYPDAPSLSATLRPACKEGFCYIDGRNVGPPRGVSKYELVINLKTDTAIGLTIP